MTVATPSVTFFSGTEALAGSVVKIAGRDVLATWKILIALGVTPVLYAFYAIIATFIAIRAKAPLKWKIWTPFLVIVALPFMNFAALKFGEAGMDVLKSVSIWPIGVWTLLLTELFIDLSLP